MSARGEEGGASWWTTLPGILTGVAAVLTAAGGLVVALRPAAPEPPAEAVVSGGAAPVDPPLEQVEGHGTREFDYVFRVPAGGGGAVLRLLRGDESREIPLDLPSA